ncbi:hypothetical protein B0H67DRAFT_577854 [Lasiosphaeris hirsuta]|uniref:Uncharacterized protein n=1 Tax=Lasiosphaeris hirsuta TaxID=260670 RepID=A0AA40E393_9PEZI|nr:hypothetical protein B0H67DRAFT_577854 [Lasiosphaeris hirsuta]
MLQGYQVSVPILRGRGRPEVECRRPIQANTRNLVFGLHGLYKTSELVAIWRHSPSIASDSSCLVTEYSRDITVCTRMNGGSVVAVTPAHDWYHAVDPDLSPSQRSPKIPCRDKSCINYYRSPASFACRAC